MQGISLLPEVSVFLRRIENVNYYMFNDPSPEQARRRGL